MTTEFKTNITRSFVRKVHLGGYESFDVFSSRSKEVPADTSLKEQTEISQELFLLAMVDVERDIARFNDLRATAETGVSQDKLIEMINSISIGGSVALEDYEKLNPKQIEIIQAVKRAYKRSPMAKNNH